MHNFSAQKEMLNAAVDLLSDCAIQSPYAFGGGTALSAYYWNHRFSTDIDIFIYIEKNEKALMKIRPANWDSQIRERLHRIGYGDEYKESGIAFPGHYIEIAINDSEKIQFFESGPYTLIPYITGDVFSLKNILIETVEEIIAKKLYYRAEKGNARDIFDIAIAVHKDPFVLNKIIEGGQVKQEHIASLQSVLNFLINDTEALSLYLSEIQSMSPLPEFSKLATKSPQYLLEFTTAFCYYTDLQDEDELKVLEEAAYVEHVQ